MGIDIHSLRPGDRVRTIDGGVAEILKESADGKWILVRYLEADDAGIIGTEDLCEEGELLELVEGGR